MQRVVPTADIKLADTIQSIDNVHTVHATTASGLKVTVPADIQPGALVILNADGTAPDGVLVEGESVFSQAGAAANLTVVG